MAETKKAKAAKAGKPRKSKAAPATRAAASKTSTQPKKRAPPRKSARASTAPKSAPRRASGSTSSGYDIIKLIDHPLVADLLAVGAMAAVAAIADHHVKTRTGEAEAGSSKAVKAAGVAAASAIGRRLMTEVNEVKKASKPMKGKRGSR